MQWKDSEFVYVDWRWLLLIGLLFSSVLLGLMLGFGLKVALAVLVGAMIFFCSIFSPEIPMLIWMLLVIHRPFMTTVLNLGVGINLTNIFLALILFGWLTGCAVKRQDPAIKSPINVPIVIVLFFAILSFLRGANYFGYDITGHTLNSFKRFITTYIVLFLSANMFRKKEFRIAALVIMMLGMGYETYVTFKQHQAVASWHYSDKMRIKGTLEGGGGANELGTYFAQGLPFVLASILELKTFPIKFPLIVFFILGVQALFYTYSRGSYLSLFLAVGGVCWFKDRRLFLAVLLIGVLTYPIWPVSVRERLSSIKYEDKSVAGRKHVWKIARQKIAHSPIIGYGYNASMYLLPRDTHNMYYDIALEMGIPALLALWILLAVILFSSWRVYRLARDNVDRIFGLGTVGSVLALILGNVFGTRLGFFPINMYFAVASGIVCGLYYEYLKERNYEQRDKDTNRD